MIPFDISRIQPRAWKIISRAYQNERVAGTYLFHGEPGVGLWALTIATAALLNCEKTPREQDESGLPVPCGECRNCRNVFALNFEGLMFALPLPPHSKNDETIDLTNQILEQRRAEPFAQITWAKNDLIRKNSARLVKRSLATKAPRDITRVVLFYSMEKMRQESADALLKLIEEPPSDTVIILTTRRPEALLPTIQSRSQVVRLQRVPADMIAEYLIFRHDIQKAGAMSIAELADGSVGRAITLLGQGKDHDSLRNTGLMLFKSLFIDSGPDSIAHAVQMLNLRDRGQISELLRLWQSLLADCNRYANTGAEENIINGDFKVDIVRLSKYFNGEQPSIDMLKAIKIALDDLRFNVHILGALSALILRLKGAVGGVTN